MCSEIRLNRAEKALIIKEKNDHGIVLRLIKQQKESLGKRKSNPQWEDVIDLTPIQQGLLSRIYRVLLKINKKKGKQCSRKIGKNVNVTPQRRMSKRPLKI